MRSNNNGKTRKKQRGAKKVKDKKSLAKENILKISDTICAVITLVSSIAIGFYLVFINEPLGDELTHIGIKMMCIVPPLLLHLVLRTIARFIIIIIIELRYNYRA